MFAKLFRRFTYTVQVFFYIYGSSFEFNESAAELKFFNKTEFEFFGYYRV